MSRTCSSFQPACSPASHMRRNPRARDLGIPFDGTPGPLNAITDVAGVTVGHITLIEDLAGRPQGAHRRHRDPAARARQPRRSPVFAGWFALNGNGEMTGTAWIEESGYARGPGDAHQHPQRRRGARRGDRLAGRARAAPDASGYCWSLPVVAETWDGHLNDINGFHVKPAARLRALDDAQRRAGGRGQRRRRHRHDLLRVQVRHRHGLAARRCVGRRATRSACWCRPTTACATRCASPACRSASTCATTGSTRERDPARRRDGSIIIVVATDAPLLPHQLKRIARRAALGPRRAWAAVAGNGSGDIFLAFSTANAGARRRTAAPQSHVARQRPDRSAVRRDRAGHRGGDRQRHGRRPRHAGRPSGHYAKALPHARTGAAARRVRPPASRLQRLVERVRSSATASSTSASLTDSGGMKRTVLDAAGQQQQAVVVGARDDVVAQLARRRAGRRRSRSAPCRS